MRIKTSVQLSGVPKGTEGEAVPDHGKWKITWDLPNRPKPLVDWFNDEEFGRLLQKVDIVEK